MFSISLILLGVLHVKRSLCPAMDCQGCWWCKVGHKKIWLPNLILYIKIMWPVTHSSKYLNAFSTQRKLIKSRNKLNSVMSYIKFSVSNNYAINHYNKRYFFNVAWGVSRGTQQNRHYNTTCYYKKNINAKKSFTTLKAANINACLTNNAATLLAETFWGGT